MAAVEDKTEVQAAESEKTAEDLKSQDKSTSQTNPKEGDSEASKDEGQEQNTNGHSKEEAKSETEPKTDSSNTALGTTVAKHYNEHPEGTKESRKESRIFHMRNFNNWIKSVMINEFLQKIKKYNYRNIHVLDLCCGKGGDLLKWQRGRIRKLVCADIAKVSVDQCEERYKDMKKTAEERRYRDPLFDTQFIVADCSKERLADIYTDEDLVFDLCSCQFSYHYSFESFEQADVMLKNACEKLKPGGYFIGTTPNAYELVNKLKKAEGLEFGNDVFQIKFENKDEFPLYGCKYDFHLEGVVDCPEFLVYFPLLEKMAKNYGMKLVYVKTFHDFFQEHSKDNMGLLSRMNALESYPPKRDGDTQASSSEESYSHAKDFLEGLQSGKTESSTSKYRDHRERSQKHVGTLSKEEWEAAGMYIAFAFVKVDNVNDSAPAHTKTAEASTAPTTTPAAEKEDAKENEAESSSPMETAGEPIEKKHKEDTVEETTDESLSAPTMTTAAAEKEDGADISSAMETARESRKRKYKEDTVEETTDEPSSKKKGEDEAGAE
ncbi:mRNA cap guanine-N7 methyltransferase-like [Actinia tenebrosa]|uniref:mRNA (guanine-N(7))-methyltransferase n=1 Tax=Actinia tenebrosa TaxID=6105 RepID=A0A6P8HIP5_ACTTE|nr:mRNA cap guanine-N7 methyltransferase-like [Actinia tenebrosa]